MLNREAEVWILIEMSVVCLLMAVDNATIFFPLWGLFLVSVQHYRVH